MVAVCDILEDKMQQIKNRYIEKSNVLDEVIEVSDYKKVLEKVKIDVAIISTESGYHEEIGLYFLENGVNIIIEKPIAMSIQGAQKLVDMAKEKNLKLAACHQNRFNYPIQLLKKSYKRK